DVRVEEVEELADERDRLRGRRARQVVGGARGRVARVSSPWEPAGPSATPGSWLCATGVVHGPAGWAATPAGALPDLDGQFALVAGDDAGDQVLVANDPLGMHALYVARTSSRLLVSTSAMVLAAHLRCPASAVGLASFLSCGYHFGTRTHWDAVERLDPGTCLTVGADAVRREQYWRPEVDARVAGMSLDRAADHALEVFEAACKERLAEQPHCLDLTGGFDSRLLALVAERAGVSFCTNTRSASRPADREIARGLAASRGWEWHDLSLPADWPERLPGVLPEALAWGDGQLEVLQLSRVLHAHRALGEHRRSLLCSAGGEHLERNWESELLNAGRSNRFDVDRWLALIAFRRGDGSVLTEPCRNAVHDDLRRRALTWVAPWSDELNVVQLDVLQAYKSTGHGGAYRGADGGHLETRLPYYWKPVMTAGLSTSYRHRNAHRLHREMIARLDPAAAALRTTHGGSARPLRSHPLGALPYQAVVGRKVVNKLSAQLLGRALFPSDPPFPWEPKAHEVVLQHLAPDGVLDLGAMRIAPLLQRDGVERLLQHTRAPEPGVSAALGRLVTAELALRATDTALEG
ncbi:MAG: hypothetical protein ACLGIG_11700, partial [Actinomycetes bacterium]